MDERNASPNRVLRVGGPERPVRYRTITELCARLKVVVTEPYVPADEIMHRLLDRIEELERSFDRKVAEARERRRRTEPGMTLDVEGH